MTDVLIRRGKDTERDTHREDDHVRMEADTGVNMQLQAKENSGCLATPEVRRKAQNRFSPRNLREYSPANRADFGLRDPRTVRKYISVALSHPFCGTLLWQLQ